MQENFSQPGICPHSLVELTLLPRPLAGEESSLFSACNYHCACIFTFWSFGLLTALATARSNGHSAGPATKVLKPLLEVVLYAVKVRTSLKYVVTSNK